VKKEAGGEGEIRERKGGRRKEGRRGRMTCGAHIIDGSHFFF
jgi:hypothetical protein